MQLNIENGTLTFDMRARNTVLDFTTVLRANLYSLTHLREIVVTDFEPRLPQPLTDGLRLQLVNDKHGLFIPIEFREQANGFRVTVKAGWVCEQMSINRRLMSVDLLPELMTTRVGDDGFYLLPDFSGTLVRFKEHVPTITRDRLYMTQTEWEKLSVMNCFGRSVRQVQEGPLADGSMLAIVHKGDFFCHCVTEVNQDGANRIYASFGLRHKPSDPIKQEDKELQVQYLDGPDVTYFDMAKVYRDYLINERGVSPLKDRIADNPVLAYSVRAMRTKIFHGLKPESLDGNQPMTVYATFEQAESILDAMQEAGIDRAVVTLVGWGPGGHDGAYPQKFPVEPLLGGEEGLRKLIAKAKAMGYQCVPHDCNTDMYMAGQTYDPEVVLRHEDNTPVLGGIWGGGQAAKACPVAYFDRYGPDVTRIRDLGFEGHYYCDAQSNPLYRCHDPRHPADEEQFALSQCKLTQAYRTLYGAVSQEVAPAYALPFLDEGGQHSPYKIERPLQLVDDNLKRIIDRVVPFYHLAIHGLITFQECWVHAYRPCGVRKGVLREIAYGARPSMEVSYTPGANGDYYKDSIRDVLEGYRIAFEELADTHVEFVVEYEELAPEASRIRYANGTELLVNWGDTPVDDLQPLTYRIDRHKQA